MWMKMSPTNTFFSLPSVHLLLRSRIQKIINTVTRSSDGHCNNTSNLWPHTLSHFMVLWTETPCLCLCILFIISLNLSLYFLLFFCLLLRTQTPRYSLYVKTWQWTRFWGKFIYVTTSDVAFSCNICHVISASALTFSTIWSVFRLSNAALMNQRGVFKDDSSTPPAHNLTYYSLHL